MDSIQPTILIVDDEKHTRDGLRRLLEDNYDVYVAADIAGAVSVLERQNVDVLLTDLRLGVEDGMQLIDRALKMSHPPICIMMTAYGSVDTAVEAMKRGAYDFVTKPLNLDKVELLIGRALRSRNLEQENRTLREQVEERYRLENIWGESAALHEVLDTIKQVAPSSANVLIEGESGTGKELAAHAIHNLSRRNKAKFVVVHCAALSPQLLESELFGHEKGAFTGASERRMGRFEQANGGTLFLDEIGEIDASTQVKLLRVISEERAFERVGGNQTLHADVRLIAATNKNLERLVQEGKFRDDLFFRLNVVRITMPPLRERKEDIPLLVRGFLRHFCRANEKPLLEVTAEAMNAFLAYDWPGNVRELRTAIEHGVVMATGPKITLRDLPMSVRQAATAPLPGGVSPAKAFGEKVNPLDLHETERKLVLQALASTRGNVTAAAKKLGISRRTLHRKINEMNAEKAAGNVDGSAAGGGELKMRGSAEELIQRGVHAIETGNLAVWLRRGLLVVGVISVATIYMYHFRGLATAEAMDQAQIGRNIAAGQLWHTNFARPRAIGQLREHGKDVTRRIWHDTYNAPLPPLLDAMALFPVKSRWTMSGREAVYIGDTAIALLSIALFLASVVILFFTARRLFDEKLAYLACGLVLICDMLWQYSLSGLPQMLLLFLFNVTTYALIHAVEARNGGGRVGPWLAATGAGFGLLALSHALTIWMLIPLLVLGAFFFRPRYWAASVVLAAFLILYTPWLLRNYIVCGSPAGIAMYSALDGIRHSEAGWMRRVQHDAGGTGPATFRDKITGNLVSQTGRIFDYLGWSAVALAFFGSLLHNFKRRDAAAVRWFILLMWAGAVLGMAVFGIREEQGVAANQLHLLFLPLMTCYGLAYLLVQWNRLGIDIHLARTVFVTGLFLICGFPMMNSLFNMLLGTPKPVVRYPPYYPPSIAVLNSWMKPEETVASDMPWAVAWYAGRRSVWVPDTVKTFTDLSDYKVLGGPVNSLYLTPISGSQNKLGDITKGEYQEWAPAILRTSGIEKLPFKWATFLGEVDCLFFSDRDRSKAKSP